MRLRRLINNILMMMTCIVSMVPMNASSWTNTSILNNIQDRVDDEDDYDDNNEFIVGDRSPVLDSYRGHRIRRSHDDDHETDYDYDDYSPLGDGFIVLSC